MHQESRSALQLPTSTHATVIMKDHAFDRELDDLGQPLEDVEWQAEANRREGEPSAPLQRRN
jgi:hypothetical protein